MASKGRSEVTAYHRHAAVLTTRAVLHPAEKQEQIAAIPRLRRKKAQAELEAQWAADEAATAAASRVPVQALRNAAADIDAAFDELIALRIPDLLGKTSMEKARVRSADTELAEALDAVATHDFGRAGMLVESAMRELLLVGGPLVVTINKLLSKAALGKEIRAELERNATARREAKLALEATRQSAPEVKIDAAVAVHGLEAESLRLVARALQRFPGGASGRRQRTASAEPQQIVQPQDCETFADVGGLDQIKEQIRATVGAALNGPDDAAMYRVVRNGILFHGPPGTGKTLLSRAIAGEYGLRYLRFTPASIGSSLAHETAANLRKLFELARTSVPCLLFLDEIDSIASDRSDQPSADHREIVTQLMASLEEYRAIPGLIIVAATNDVNRLDPGLREGRFDARIHLPLPDAAARKEIFQVLLDRLGDGVDWTGVDLVDLARRCGGRNAAAIAGYVSAAAQQAMTEQRPVVGADIVAAISASGGADRISLEDKLTWDDVVLDEDTRETLDELFTAFAQPEVARKLGVSPPPGILLHGPPGTGKTTVAKVLAAQVEASFYELSAADILSKWAGEAEQRVARLFEKARNNRPSLVFIDEVEGLLRRRSGETTPPWEQRVVGQFLRELDGLRGGEGVLLVGATNRVDIIDEAVVGRRLTPIEVGLPGLPQRVRLLQLLLRDVACNRDVDIKSLAGDTDGMSGADLKRLRDAAGMKALARSSRSANGREPTVKMADFEAALRALRGRASLAQV